MAQTLLPSSDIDRGSWTTGSGGTTNLYQQINDSSDTGGIDGTGASGVAKFALTNPTGTPSSFEGTILSVRAEKFTSSAVTLLAYLKDGTTTIATLSCVLNQGAFATFSHTVTTGEAALIVDPTGNSLQVWFDVSGTSATTSARVAWASVAAPNPGVTISGATWSATASITDPTVGVGYVIDGETWSATASITGATITQTSSVSRNRDVFATYNSSTDTFHVGQVDVTAHPEPGVGQSSVVDAQHFAFKVSSKELYRFKYEDTFPSAFINREALTTAEVGGAYNDRPDSVIFGFWSYGAFPTYDTANNTLLYEASLPRDLTTVPTTNGYPFYGSGQPDEDCFFVLPAHDFGQPLVEKTFKRLWLWLVPREGVSATVNVTATIRPQPSNSAANAPDTLDRTIAVPGFLTTYDTPAVPVKRVYIDFQPIADTTTPRESMSGEAFEVTVAVSTAIGIYRAAVEVEIGGDVQLLEYLAY